MSLLESMFGRIAGAEDRCKFSSDRYDVTFTVSTESHDVAYAIPVSAAELDALAELIRVERETPYVEDGNDSLSAALESVLDDDSIDAETWVERMAEPRRTVEPILETWQGIATGGGADDGDREIEGGDPGTEGDHRETEDDDPGSEDGASAQGVDGERDATVVYLPVGMESAVASFFDLCRRRDERESDPFGFPEDVAPAARLLSRINAATDRAENRVVVNRRHLPL